MNIQVLWVSNGFVIATSVSKIVQKKFSTNLLSKMGLEKCKPAVSPMDSGIYKRLQDLEQELDMKKATVYREVTGSLIWLSTISRPDISFAVGLAARFMSNLTQLHWEMVQRIARYVAGTVKVGITLGGDSTLTAYCDSDSASF